MPDRDATGDRTRASCFPRRQPASARHSDELREPPRLFPGRGGSVACDAVIPAPLIVVLRRGPVARFDDEALFEHPLNRSIQRTRAELQLPVRAPGDILDDRVAVAVLVCESEEDVESGN